MAELEWFPLYWQRFLLGTRDFTTEEVGAYFLLLLEEWDKGFLPDSDKELKKISGISVKKLQNVLKKFKKIDGKLYNSALEIIRIEQSEKAAKYSKRGTNAAEARWNKQCTSNAQASDKQCLDDAIREEENKKRKEEDEKRENLQSELPKESSDQKTEAINPVPPPKSVQSNLERFRETFTDQESSVRYLKGVNRPLSINRILQLAESFDIAHSEEHPVSNYNNWKKYFRYFLNNHRETKQPEQQQVNPNHTRKIKYDS